MMSTEPGPSNALTREDIPKLVRAVAEALASSNTRGNVVVRVAY